MELNESARYILLLIDSKFKEHDGKIFCSYKDAKEYANNCILEKYCDKIVVGMFSLNTQSKEMIISMVETIGFANDKKNANQLELFK